MTTVAESTRRFIHDNKMCKGRFSWQNSAAAFSVSKSEIDRLCRYILTQAEHHRKVTFQEEYKELMDYYQKTLKPFKVDKIKGNKVLERV